MEPKIACAIEYAHALYDVANDIGGSVVMLDKRNGQRTPVDLDCIVAGIQAGAFMVADELENGTCGVGRDAKTIRDDLTCAVEYAASILLDKRSRKVVEVINATGEDA